MNKDTVKALLDSGKITPHQAKGMLLEIVTYDALVSMGIYPIPLHNPFSEDYAKDKHLSVDMIFRHNSKTYAVECKNLNHNCEWTREWVAKEVVSRFEYLEKTVPVDYRLLVTTYTPRNIPIPYRVIATHREATMDNLHDMTMALNKLISALLNLIEIDNSLYSIHGYWRKNEYKRLKRIDERLRREDLKGWIE